MGDNDEWIHNHLIFYVEQNLEFILEWEFDDISDYNMKDMEKIAIIFYDSSELWKYLDVDISSNIIGDPITNAGFVQKNQILHVITQVQQKMMLYIMMHLNYGLLFYDVI